MGLDINVHIGAYVEIMAEPIYETEDVLMCPFHRDVKTGAFCPKCGHGLVLLPITEVNSPSLYTLMPEDEYADRLSEADVSSELDVVYAVGNWNADETKIEISRYGATLSELTPDMLAKFIEAFNAEYADVLAVLRERATSVDVKFGVLTWWS